jgi:hypothetical protein
MKVTVELSDQEMKDILRFSGEKRKGAAIRTLAVESLQLRKREILATKFRSGEWSVNYPTAEEMRKWENPWRA